MQEYSSRPHSPVGLETHGITNVKTAYWNLSTPALYEEAIKRNEGIIAHLGPLVVRTGQFTGRSPNDKFVVKEPTQRRASGGARSTGPSSRIASTNCTGAWPPTCRARMSSSRIAGPAPIPSTACRCASSPSTPGTASLCATCSSRPRRKNWRRIEPEFVVIDCPGFHALPEYDETNSDVFILVNFAEKLVLIGGTEYAGEIKKSIFTVMNYLLPFHEVHAHALLGQHRARRRHGPLLRPERHRQDHPLRRPQAHADRRRRAWLERQAASSTSRAAATPRSSASRRKRSRRSTQTTRRFGTILENVGIDTDTRRLDLDDGSLTENTRAAYPISHIPNATRDGRGGHPKNIIFLTADAFGVLPPISRLTPEQAMYHFISGYTAKVAGTERGVTEPQATFSACFGAPFMALHPSVYASLLGEKIEEHKVNCWLVNTGWTGGPPRRGQPHEDRLHAGHGQRRARRRAGRRRVCGGPDLRRAGADQRTRRAGRGACSRATPGRTRRPTTRRRRSWPGCSRRTSSNSPTTCRRRSAPPVRRGRRGEGRIARGDD